MPGAQDKTIRRVLKKKLTAWINSIKDENLRALALRDAFVTGGSIASMKMGDPINDYDVYFKTKETVIALSKYYCAKFKELNPKGIIPEVREEQLINLNGGVEDRVVIWCQSAGAAGEQKEDAAEYQYFEQSDNANGDSADAYVQSITQDMQPNEEGKERFRPIFLSQNAITLSDSVQLVIRFYGDAEEIYKNYDFAHVQQHYDLESDKLYGNLDAMNSLASKTLRYTGSLYPICSIFRAKKFIERGWKINAGQMLKMAFQCSKIDWHDRQMVREQLTGVDAAYFHQLINKLEESGFYADDGRDIDDIYFCRLIDEIFEGQVF